MQKVELNTKEIDEFVKTFWFLHFNHKCILNQNLKVVLIR